MQQYTFPTIRFYGVASCSVLNQELLHHLIVSQLSLEVRVRQASLGGSKFRGLHPSTDDVGRVLRRAGWPDINGSEFGRVSPLDNCNCYIGECPVT